MYRGSYDDDVLDIRETANYNLEGFEYEFRVFDTPQEVEDPERAQELGGEIIKNTYRTLMTRGMRGCYVYATDPALREHLKRRAADVGEG